MRGKVVGLLFAAANVILNVGHAQHSVARKWNEVLLQAIRNDYARPTVHARNLFHISAAMYDAWAIYDDVSTPYFLNSKVNGFSCPCRASTPSNVTAAREEAISYAAYRLIHERFALSPGYEKTKKMADSLLVALGFDANVTAKDAAGGTPATLGNYIADCAIKYGLGDGSNEQNAYKNLYYEPVNPALVASLPGSQGIVDPNRWQPLAFDIFIDQAGNSFPALVTPFLGAEWGNVRPFSLAAENEITYTRDNNKYKVYHDAGEPPLLQPIDEADPGLSANYKWSFSLVSIWSSHLDPTDNEMWDISPKSIGNLSEFPATPNEYESFYDLLGGGDRSHGRLVNPKTNLPYSPQWVPRGDYARVLAEFWADGPNSETPPGHWFVILNYVSDHPLFEKRMEGKGEIVDNLEWDVKAYFVLGGAMHDAAITAWGIKGCYDYIRPISAIRYMGDMGQSSDPGLPHYSPHGFELVDGYIELVKDSDPLAGPNNENLNKIKLFSWRGPEHILDPKSDVSGVGWILAENWWPYQRPTFITPPFAGYISGHSTYSRAAAEVLTALTGDPYFPGGMGEFDAPKNEFLVFEDGPSVDVVLQWATYRDAADQCSLSRIWGGIHPPADDMPGRKIGRVVGTEAFELAKRYFDGELTEILGVEESDPQAYVIYPNPLNNDGKLYIFPNTSMGSMHATLYNINGEAILDQELSESSKTYVLDVPPLSSGLYLLKLSQKDTEVYRKVWAKD